ncbi:MAG: sugar nucleotide-binding protein, partial [Clostridiales bacterium]|nr:sugar nucleotide-binding protein [Clostridiales bacterium]
MKILVLGATGMAGHVITTHLCERCKDVTAFSRRPFPYCENIIGDAEDFYYLRKIISENNFDVIVNAVGLLAKDSEKNKSNAVLTNSYLPHFLSNLPPKIIHLSTDCVFSGSRGNYKENDLRDGEIFYDRSKSLGELNNGRDLTLRQSIIGPDINENGIGL